MSDNNYIAWEFEGDLVKNQSIASMDALAVQESKNISPLDISQSEYIHKEAFGYYPWAGALLKKAELVIGKKISGVVADLGSGTGMMAALLSKLPDVLKVYAIEYSVEHVRSIMPVTFRYLSAEEDKIQRVVGSFNKMKVVDNFFDVITEVNSLHHAEDLNQTVREVHRVLKPGGYVIALDRGQANWVSDVYLAKLLNTQMSPKQKQIFNLPDNFTREMWGEHEYRFKEWKNIFIRNGFETSVFVFPRKNPLLVGHIMKIFFRLFGDIMLKLKIDRIPYYRWFLPYFKGSNMLLIAKKL